MPLLRRIQCVPNSRPAGWFCLVMVLLMALPTTLEAAVSIDTSASTEERSFNTTGAQTVFISDTVGYTFYRDDSNQCVYRKSTDSGATWGSSVLVDDQFDCAKIAVWYDGWTPGSTGEAIHIVTMDTAGPSNALYYNRLDTSTDTRLTGSSAVSITSGQSPSFSVPLHTFSLTVATDGTIYAAAADNDDAFVVSCAASCGSGSNWSEVGSNPLDLDEDHTLLTPLAGGDVLLVNRDITANEIRSKVWDGSSWSGSWSTIDSSAPESQTYDGGMNLLVEPSSGDVYLVYVADNDNFTTADHDVRTATYSGGTWSAGTDVITNASGLHDVAIGVDRNTGDLYAAYTRRSTLSDATSADVYYRFSTDGASTWGSEQGPVNNSSGDLYGLNSNQTSFERLFASWFDPAGSDWLGATLIDIGPDVELAATGSLPVAVRASSTAVHLGGAFTLTAQSTTTVDGIVLTETGSINASSDLARVSLRYDLDTSAPRTCDGEAYGGTEPRFGATATSGFSGANGTVSFTDSVTIGPAQTLCVYPVLDVRDGAPDGATIALEISDPVNDVTVSGVSVFPNSAVALTGSTTVAVDDLDQTGYHWRNDDGTEVGATSATGGSENTPRADIPQGTPTRLRLAVSAAGSTTSAPTDLTLQFATAAPTCASASGWSDVGAADDDWNLAASTFLSNGNDTTNISLSSGGVSDPNPTFQSSNGGVRDTSDTVDALVLATDEFAELEFGLVASTTSTEGDTYCFRLVRDGGTPLQTYTTYPSVTIAADVSVSATGTQPSSATIPVSDHYLGGTFVFTENVSSRSLTDIVLTETGSIDASTALANVRLQYDLDTTAPYDCASESYDAGDPQFGSTVSAGFSGADGAAAFTDAVTIATTSTLCGYVVFDITESASNGDTIDVRIDDPSGGDVLATAATVAPSTPVTITGTTALDGPDVTQAHYHWRNDDGTEVDATSATNGNEDTALSGHALSSALRLRLAIGNAGAAASSETRFQLEFGAKVTTCENVPAWTDVAAPGDEWEMATSTFLSNGADTTNITEADGGVTDPNPTFLTSNGGRARY